VTDRLAVRAGRALASPVGVLITIPALVVAVGLGIMLVGRDATLTAAHDLARHQLAEQATSVQNDVAFALDQADPLLASVRVLADRDHALDDVLLRFHDLMTGRPGVAFVSISFPDGTFRGARLMPDRSIELQESHPGEVHRYAADGNALRTIKTEPTPYDPRQRDFYKLAVHDGARTWTQPYTFYLSHETGISCAEPLYDGDKLLAVITVDFHVGALSSYVAKPALDHARSIVYTRDGTILAYPAAGKLPGSDKLLRAADLHDPAVDALLAEEAPVALRLLELRGGEYLASVAPIGGKRAGVAVPLDWYVATVVPASALLGPTHALERSSALASAGALAIAVGIALVLAWNLVRMRRQVAKSRAEAKSAEARAKELGSYRLVAKLGRGGMGEVWRAEHRLLARLAAIKLIRPEALAEPAAIGELKERFRREAQTLASMKSRHTIAIFDYGVTEQGVFYYVMELLDGLDLESLIVRYGPQPAARVIQLLVQACASLAEAHDAELLHRDIKPPNLYVCRAAEEVDICKLLDFGIVQTRNEPPRAESDAKLAMAETPKLTQVGAMLGTPGFMAPEQILGMQLDGRADLYALGCVAWWLLTGKEVYDREAGEAKLHHAHIFLPLPSLRGMCGDSWLPDELERVISSCLAKEPDERPKDARVLAAQLRAIVIPDEHAWTEARAQRWWQSYRPPAAVPSLPSNEVQVLVPGRRSERKSDPEAVTVIEVK
jgi:serine/threonine protein kinase